MRDLILDILLGLITAVLIPALPILFLKLGSWLSANIQAKWLAELAEKGTQVAKEVVLALFQTTVAEMKKAKDPTSPGGASITKDEAKIIAQKALAGALASLGPAFVKGADKALGAGTVAAAVAQKLEAAVLMAKAQGLDQVASPKKEEPLVAEAPAAPKEDAAPVPLAGSTPASSSPR